jgi:hypothetical protein
LRIKAYGAKYLYFGDITMYIASRDRCSCDRGYKEYKTKDGKVVCEICYYDIKIKDQHKSNYEKYKNRGVYEISSNAHYPSFNIMYI